MITGFLFRVLNLNEICTERCEASHLQCILNCPSNDVNCLSQCIREETECTNGKFFIEIVSSMIVETQSFQSLFKMLFQDVHVS